MKSPINKFILLLIIAFYSCSTDSNDTNDVIIDDTSINQNGNGNSVPVTIDTNLNQADIDALLFMLEEEKLARDTYGYLFGVWNQTIFSNIQNSEQSHMNAIITLLDANEVSYTVLPEGEFSVVDLQDFYNQFVIDGEVSSTQALTIGATIEDLDIADLDTFIINATSTSLVEVFESLQCGSRNHLRSFYSKLQNVSADYNPQFISQEEFNTIITSSNEQCN